MTWHTITFSSDINYSSTCNLWWGKLQPLWQLIILFIMINLWVAYFLGHSEEQPGWLMRRRCSALSHVMYTIHVLCDYCTTPIYSAVMWLFGVDCRIIADEKIGQPKSPPHPVSYSDIKFECIILVKFGFVSNWQKWLAFLRCARADCIWGTKYRPKTKSRQIVSIIHFTVYIQISFIT